MDIARVEQKVIAAPQPAQTAASLCEKAGTMYYKGPTFAPSEAEIQQEMAKWIPGGLTPEELRTEVLEFMRRRWDSIHPTPAVLLAQEQEAIARAEAEERALAWRKDFISTLTPEEKAACDEAVDEFLYDIWEHSDSLSEEVNTLMHSVVMHRRGNGRMEGCAKCEQETAK